MDRINNWRLVVDSIIAEHWVVESAVTAAGIAHAILYRVFCLYPSGSYFLPFPGVSLHVHVRAARLLFTGCCQHMPARQQEYYIYDRISAPSIYIACRGATARKAQTGQLGCVSAACRSADDEIRRSLQLCSRHRSSIVARRLTRPALHRAE